MEARAVVLRAVSDALFPPLEARAAERAAAGDTLAAQLFRHGGASDEVIYKVIETIEGRLPLEARRELYLLLRLLGSRLGSLLLLGRASFSGGFGLPSSFVDLPREQREAVLQAWSGSSDAKMRKAFKALKSLVMSAQFTYLTPPANSDLLAAMGYPIIDPARPPTPAPAAVAAEAAVAAAVVDLSGHDSSPGSAAGAGAALAAKGLRVVWPGDLAGAAVTKERPQLAVQCDVVIVGSGAGGGVAAANLARAGLRVVVLEKAGFVPARDMTQQEGQAFQSMYEQGGILASEDGTMSVLAGSTLGGGTRINWCASFKTPAHVRKEWAERYGLPDFASERYDEALDAVCSRLSVHTGFKHSNMCSALQRGLEGLGVHCAEVPRNCLNPDCGGHCCLGCARGYKQDTVNTWLADACRAGARIITGVWAERVLTEAHTSQPTAAGGHTRRKKAVGVLAFAGSGSSPLRLAIQASVVISAAGSIHSPALLLRSRVTSGGNVGTNLHLHPCTCVVGLFPPAAAAGSGKQQGQPVAVPSASSGGGPGGSQEEAASAAPPPAGDMEDLAAACKGVQRQQEEQQLAAGISGADGGKEQQQQQQRRLHMLDSTASTTSGGGTAQVPGSIRCWEGTLMSIFSTQVGDWEGSGYGSLLYTPAVHPGLFAAAAPWVGGDDFKHLMLQYPNACIVLVLVRDQDAGRVVIDRGGRPRIHYTLSKKDEASVVKGVELGLRTMAAAGAGAVMTMLNSPAGRCVLTEEAARALPATTPTIPAASGSGISAAAGAAAGEEPGVVSGSTGALAEPAGSGPPGADGDGSSGSGAATGAAFEEYLAGVVRTGVVPLQMPQFTAHQMGTCRLGADPKSSVLDPSGECWEVSDLYCCDGSTFPSPTGVNPMISIESISYMLTQQLAQKLAGQAGSGAGAGRRQTSGSKL